MEKDVEEMETKMKDMQQERIEIEEDAKKLLKCVEEIAEQLAEGDEAFSGNIYISKHIRRYVKIYL